MLRRMVLDIPDFAEALGRALEALVDLAADPCKASCKAVTGNAAAAADKEAAD